jgi:hypothetical protein
VLEQAGGYERLMALLKPTPHRVLPLPRQEQVMALLDGPEGLKRVHEIFKQREEAIEREQLDPYRYGMVLEPWRDAMELLGECFILAVFGGNRAAKTEFGAWWGVKKLVEKPAAQGLWLHESEQTSIDVQQLAVHKYLPLEWKEAKKSKITNISWSRKNGFSDNKLVLPNGSVGKFGSYKQDIGDYEGLEYDFIVADENLPLAWLRTLLVRLATRAGKFIWCYTPIRGLTPAGKEITDGAITLETRPVDADVLDPLTVHVEGCPRGTMPYTQRSPYGAGETRIIYFHSDMNPYGGYEELKKMLRGFDKEDRKRRGYGYARNTIMTLFPMFGAAHVIEAERVPESVTRYHFADPAGARNMFQIWVGVDKDGRHYVYREWPDVPRFGDWAVPAEDNRRWDGAMGIAQPTVGYGVLEYKRQILSDEGNRWDAWWVMCGEQIEQRYMDPRSGAAQAITETEGGSSLMDRMRGEHYNDKKLLEGPGLDFFPAKGLREDEGIQAVADLLSYNRNEPITALVNEPKLFVTRNCQNVIWALKNYTGHDGEKAACKDPIDCLRYMATEELQWLDPKREVVVMGGTY